MLKAIGQPRSSRATWGKSHECLVSTQNPKAVGKLAQIFGLLRAQLPPPPAFLAWSIVRALNPNLPANKAKWAEFDKPP